LETLGERLREMRNRRKYTQEQAGELIGVTLRTVQNHEGDKSKPPRLRLKQYAAIYECSWQWLLTGKATYSQPEEHMLPRREHEAPDSGPGQLRIPDFKNFRISRVIGPEEGRRAQLHVMLDDILSSDNVGLKEALTAALEQIVLLMRKGGPNSAFRETPPRPAPKGKNESVGQSRPSSTKPHVMPARGKSRVAHGPDASLLKL
jgi:transcriptional regulator with XRE-family HTH domain